MFIICRRNGIFHFKESDNSKIPKGVYSVYIGNKFDLNIRIYTIHYFFKFTMYHHHQYM